MNSVAAIADGHAPRPQRGSLNPPGHFHGIHAGLSHGAIHLAIGTSLAHPNFLLGCAQPISCRSRDWDTDKTTMALHAHYPDVLVAGENVMNLISAGARPIQVDLDPEAYCQGHIPGATSWDWEKKLRNQSSLEILSKREFEVLMEESGITPSTLVILYGDNNNWFACWAFWMMHLYGHTNVRLIDGGMRKWINSGHPLDAEEPTFPKTEYQAADAALESKASIENIFESFFNPDTHRLLDVRSAAEFQGKLMSPGVGTQAKCEIAGHIPTAINVPWNLNCNVDGTFKTPEELRALYACFDILPEMNVITYCAIGERASLSWFVLKHLIGYNVVMNYDRSMAQWSRIANAPISTGEAA